MQSWAARRARTTIVYGRCVAVRRRVAQVLARLQESTCAVRSCAGTSGARKFGILREGLPEYGKTCRSAAQLVEAPLLLGLLSLLCLLVPHRPLALLADRRALREKGESVGRRQIILVETAGRARKPAGYSSNLKNRLIRHQARVLPGGTH